MIVPELKIRKPKTGHDLQRKHRTIYVGSAYIDCRELVLDLVINFVYT
jgi:hypothetical protein